MKSKNFNLISYIWLKSRLYLGLFIHEPFHRDNETMSKSASLTLRKWKGCLFTSTRKLSSGETKKDERFISNIHL